MEQKYNKKVIDIIMEDMVWPVIKIMVAGIAVIAMALAVTNYLGV